MSRQIQSLLLWAIGLAFNAALAATPPSPVSLSPSVSSGASQTLSLTFNAPGGYQTLDVLNVLINTYLDGRQACYLAYSRSSNALYIVADNGDASQISGKVMDGTGTVSNRQCSINLASSSTSANGNTLTLVLSLTFAASFAGNKVVYAAARDLSQNNSGWNTMGVHHVPGAPITYPNPVGLSPASGNTQSQTLTFTYQDETSATNLQTAWALINTALDGRDACYVAYYRPGNQLYLIPDDGDGSQARNIALGSGGTLSNSQCSISTQGASAQTSGNTLTVTLPITFTTVFVGFKAVWMAAQTTNGQTSPWQALGAEVVPADETAAPVLTVGVPSQQAAGALFSVTVPLDNIGGSAATGVQVSAATLGTLAAVSPVFPALVGSIAAGASTSMTLTFSTAALTAGTNYVFTLGGSYQASGGTLPFTAHTILTYAAPDPFRSPANPVAVNPVLDTSHSTTQTIAASQGGTIKATGSDGSAFTLTIPANALLSDETITMTPVASIAGLPTSGGLLAAVQLSPDGLQLQQAATLTIQPAVSVSAGQQVGFGYHASGQEFYLQPLGLTGTIVMSLTHFSASGVGRGEPVNPGVPTSAADRYDALIEALATARRCQLLSGANCGGMTQEDLNNLFDAYSQAFYKEGLVPELQAALTEDGKALEAIAQAWAWQRSLEVLGLDTSKEPYATEIAFITKVVPNIVLNAFNKAYDRCKADTQPTDRISEGVRMLWAQTFLITLYGYSTSSLITSCLTPLTLDIDSTVNQTEAPPPPSSTYKSHVTAQGIQLQFDPIGRVYRGGGPLTYASLSFSVQWGNGFGDCSSGTGNSGSVDVLGIFDLNLVVGNVLGVLKGGTPLVHVAFNPNVTETISVGILLDDGCHLTPPGTTSSPGHYGIGIKQLHVAYYNDPSGPSPYLVFLNSAFPFVFSLQAGGASASENTLLTLRAQ